MEQSLATSQIFNADCLEKMKDLDDDSVDLIFCDLPYGQTSCKWDCCIDLELFWKEVMRIKKLHTPIFFTTTTKFGVSLIQSAPKKCFFRYDLVWVKSASAGFLSAKKMPMRKHEMIYVFYEKLPFYDLSSHTNKFKQEYNDFDNKDGAYGVIKSQKGHPEPLYNPPLPVSVVKEDSNIIDGETYNTKNRKKPITREPADKYDPPLPVSVVKEDKTQIPAYYLKDGKTIYNGGKSMGIFNKGGTAYEPPLPVSVVKQDSNSETIYGGAFNGDDNADKMYQKAGRKNNESVYNPPLPNSMLEIKSTRGKHSTEKPVALMEWIFKYYSKEGDVVLDPTCGSGSTGVACKNMNRNFIGIEMDEDIFKVAEERLK